MTLDFEDILGSAFGRLLVISLFLASGVWVGSVVGALAIIAGMRRLPESEIFLWAPMLLFNVWLILNVAFLAGIVIWIFVADGLTYLAWGILVGIESIFVLLGFTFDFTTPPLLETVVAWTVWLILLLMLETGVWLIHNMRRNRWAREMAALSAENAMLRAERDAARDGGPHDELHLDDR